MTTEEKLHQAEVKLTKALWLLREWRDEHGGKEYYKFRSYHSPDVIATVSMTDLLRDTNRMLEGK